MHFDDFATEFGVGDLIAGPSVEDVNTLDQAIRELDTDITNHATPDGHALDPKVLAWRKFKIDWVAFRLKWEDWKETHNDAIDRTSDEGITSFGNLSNEYTEFKRRFVTEFQGQTNAPNGPTETGPLGAVSSVPWGTIVGVAAIGVGIWFLAPLVKR